MQTKSVPAILKPCARCDRNFECGVLASALAILEKHQALVCDPESRALYNAFLRRINSYGFAYPEGTELCGLATEKGDVRGLLDEAVRLNRVLSSRIAQKNLQSGPAEAG
jgi:hypothetical protein